MHNIRKVAEYNLDTFMLINVLNINKYILLIDKL